MIEISYVFVCFFSRRQIRRDCYFGHQRRRCCRQVSLKTVCFFISLNVRHSDKAQSGGCNSSPSNWKLLGQDMLGSLPSLFHSLFDIFRQV